MDLQREIQEIKWKWSLYMYSVVKSSPQSEVSSGSIHMCVNTKVKTGAWFERLMKREKSHR